MTATSGRPVSQEVGRVGERLAHAVGPHPGAWPVGGTRLEGQMRRRRRPILAGNATFCGFPALGEAQMNRSPQHSTWCLLAR